MFPPLLPETTTAASLAHHGMLGSVKWMVLENMDLASVPAEHLTSLTSCVTKSVDIYNVNNCDLTSILDSARCEFLNIGSQTLSSEETRALVRAMESRVEEVMLGVVGEVHLDITALTQYSGRGKCGWKMWCYEETEEKYKKELRSWREQWI